eukprot:s1957_g13.t1
MAGLQNEKETGGIHGSSDVARRASQGNHGGSADQSRIVSYFKKQITSDSPSEKRQTTIRKFFKKQQGENMPTKQTRFVKKTKTVVKLGSADTVQQDVKKTTAGGNGSKQANPNAIKFNNKEPTLVADVPKNCGPPRECVSALWSGGMPMMMMMDGGNMKMSRADPDGFGYGHDDSPSPRPKLRRSDRLCSGSFSLSPTTTEEFPGDDFANSPCQASPVASSSMTKNRQLSSAVESLPASNAKSQ